MLTSMADHDSVRARSSPDVNARIDRETMQRLRHFADGELDALQGHLQHLGREWDIDRVLEVNAAAIGLAGLALGVAHDRRWLVVPAVVLSLLGLHAVQGWCPPVPLLRRSGVRTRQEIERERYALKGMRGDFEGTTGRSQAAWRAVRS